MLYQRYIIQTFYGQQLKRPFKGVRVEYELDHFISEFLGRDNLIL